MTLIRELQQTSRHLRKQRAPHPASTPILRVEHLSVVYNNAHLALEDLTFELRRGERLAVVGPNGAGKSTLFKVIAGVLPPTRGRVDVFGNQPDGHICIAYVPQRSQVDWHFPVTVADVVMMGRVGQLGLFRSPRREDWQLVHQALETVEMADCAQRQIGELSGGQQQRMFIARALAQQAELMLMDEPFSGLDVQSQEALFDILETLRGRGVTVLLSLHDLNMAARRFDRVLLLRHRLLGIGTAQEVLTAENLLRAYGGHLQLVDGTIVVGDTCCDDDVHGLG